MLSKEDIEEIIYDTFFAMWSNKEKLILDNSITAYLVAIAKYLITHKYRKIKFEFNIEECESESSLISYDDIVNVLETKENYTSKGTILKNEEDNMKQYISEYQLNKYLVTENLYIQIEGTDTKIELQKLSKD